MKVCIFFLLINSCFLHGHSQIYVKGQISPSDAAKGSIKKISVMRPIGIYPQPWFADSSDDLHIQENGEVNQTLPFSQPNLVFLSLPSGQQFRVFAAPGDTISFRLSMDSGPSVNCRFSGKDSFCNNYLNQMNQTINNSIRHLQQQNYDGRSLINQIDSFIQREKYRVNRNTQSMVKAKFLDLSIESVTLWIAINLYGHTSDGSPKREENDLICRELYERFNPLQDKYIITRTGLINIEALANTINEKRNYVATNAFQKADSVWSLINESYQKTSTFPEPFREGQIGNYILIDAVRFKSPDTRKAIFYFARQYPQSPFLAIFSKILESDTSGALGKDFPFERKADTTQSEFTFINKGSSLKNVLDKYAKGKPVIIDCWATWCVYCIVEFPHYAQHDKLFKENDVVKLYLSFDAQANASGWEEISRAWKLSGIHVLGDKALQAEFAKLIKFPTNKVIPLPRYVLLNSKHEVVNDDMVRPSNPEFDQQLCKDLKCDTRPMPRR